MKLHVIIVITVAISATWPYTESLASNATPVSQSVRGSKGKNENAIDFVRLYGNDWCTMYKNLKVFLENRHGSRDIKVTVRWRVDGGNYSTKQFRASAGSDFYIGCAAAFDITGARFIN